MKIKDFVNLGPAELMTRRTDLKQEIFNLRLQQSSGVLENPARIKNLRRDIAKIETVLSAQRAASAAK